MTLVTVLLVSMACYRITLLLIADTITEPPRRRLLEWLAGRRHQDAELHVLAHDPDGVEQPGMLRVACTCGWYAERDQHGTYVADPVPSTVDLTERFPDLRRMLTDHQAEHRTDPGGKLGVLVTCPWCVSVYVGAAMAAVAWAWPHGWWRWPALALTASATTGLLATAASPNADDD